MRKAAFGVFLTACNTAENKRFATDRLTIEDSLVYPPAAALWG